MKFRNRIIALSELIKSQTDKKIAEKTKFLKEELLYEGSPHNMYILPELSVPHDPCIKVYGVYADESIIFKSAI